MIMIIITIMIVKMILLIPIIMIRRRRQIMCIDGVCTHDVYTHKHYMTIFKQ